MKTAATFLLALTLATAQAGNYEKAMASALADFQKCQTVEDFTKAANQFERIAMVEKQEWLPLYYHAQSYILISFMSKETADQKDMYLDLAQKSIDVMMKIDAEESEIYAIQSFLHTARLVVDPMNRGQSMMVASGKAIEKSLELNPNNPRAQYLLLSNEVGMAEFFGKEIAEYCPRIKTLYANWDSMNSTKDFYPKWGKAQVEGLLEGCE